ncbi:MAG: hypothetical protein HRU38_04445 [Saccharospirillaceae bacterium]|nr:hypothetical protein [Pseudomonadales bacterium]NRB77909.1 hypothetical protein [Saccharospirillaceae bacterium]
MNIIKPILVTLALAFLTQASVAQNSKMNLEDWTVDFELKDTNFYDHNATFLDATMEQHMVGNFYRGITLALASNAGKARLYQENPQNFDVYFMPYVAYQLNTKQTGKLSASASMLMGTALNWAQGKRIDQPFNCECTMLVLEPSVKLNYHLSANQVITFNYSQSNLNLSDKMYQTIGLEFSLDL